MPHLALLSASIRTGRNSHRVALFLRDYLHEKNLATTDILDLEDYSFPLFTERLSYLKDPGEKVLDFAAKFRAADGIIIITPEYNGGYPASLKNVVDLLTDDWRRKPVAIATVSDGPFGGTQVIASLQFTLWKMRAWVVPAMFPVPKVREAFDVKGLPSDPQATGKRAAVFIQELLWCLEASHRMQD